MLKNYIVILIGLFIAAIPLKLNAHSANKNSSNNSTIKTKLASVESSITLNGKFDIYFDGLDDYAAEPAVINSWEEVSIMTWIKLDSLSSGVQIIAGQRSFYLQLNTNKSITAFANSKSLTSKTLLNTNQWYHVTITHKPNAFNLYINGETEASRLTSSGNINHDTSSFTIGRYPDYSGNYFHGSIDEFRLFDKALTTNELRKMIYQEIQNNEGNVMGNIIPKNITNFNTDTKIATPLSWDNLKRYYKMDSIESNILLDTAAPLLSPEIHAVIYNVDTINEQTAPLPFITNQSGELNKAIHNVEAGINGEDAATINWSIVNIKHNDVYFSKQQVHIGLIINKLDANLNPITYIVRNGSELNVSWYLNLNGTIDLQGESQLIQGIESTLEPSSDGVIKTTKQLEGDIYTYNYWSSPVGKANSISNNNTYKVSDIITNLDFAKSGYNGTATSIADYWIWKYCNLSSQNKSVWQQIKSTGSINAGEGFTMKGTGTNATTITQDYNIEGKPNNGDINIPVYAGSEYLIGNPYPSPIDAQQFILDNNEENSGVTTGTLYFKEHYSGGSHSSNNFTGGYATYSLAGGVPAVWQGENTASNNGAVHTPKQYIPVGQAFFVLAQTSGDVAFNNGQRVFNIENNLENKSSAYTKITEKTDTRLKLRIGFSSVNKINRQLLITEDEYATSGYDSGFDAKEIDTQTDDMYWLINNEKFSIQGTNRIDETTTIPLGVQTRTNGTNTISINELENFPEALNIYLHDKTLNITQSLKEQDYDVYLEAGAYLDRFEITFSQPVTLSVDHIEDKNIQISYTNTENKIIISNPKSQNIEAVALYNVIGQNIFEIKTNNNNSYIEYSTNQLKSGIYILKVDTDLGEISKKIMVQ